MSRTAAGAVEHAVSELRSVQLSLPTLMPSMLRDEVKDVAMVALAIYEAAMTELVARTKQVRP